MSIIAFKVLEDKIQVAADGRAVSDDKIVSEEVEKIKKISDSLIIGATGLCDTIEVFEEFAKERQEELEGLNNNPHLIRIAKEFKEYSLEEYGYTNETIINSFGGFLFINQHLHAAFYFDENGAPYLINEYEDVGTIGSTRDYTKALIDIGMPIDEAIRKSAESYTSINGNVTFLEIERKR